MLLAMLFALGASAVKPGTIYVGPLVRDGFVETAKGISEAIEDIRKELRKDKTLLVVPREADASLNLYVLSRAEVEAKSTSVSSGSAAVVGGAVIGSGTTSQLKDG